MSHPAAADTSQQHPPRSRLSWRGVALFVALVIAIDLVSGAVLHALFERTRTGDLGGKLLHALDQRPEVLVLGSSRAVHHVESKLLAERLGQTVYNAGVDGHDLVYAYLLLNLWKSRQLPLPRRILLQIEPDVFLDKPDEWAAASLFGPLIDENDAIREALWRRGRWERVKYLSHAYRYNARVLAILRNQWRPLDKQAHGFEGRDGTVAAGAPRRALPAAAQQAAAGPADPLKLRYFEEIYLWCELNGVELVLFHSPAWREYPVAHQAMVKRIAGLQRRFGRLRWIDLSHYAEPKFSTSAALFCDDAHLNRTGARQMTVLLASKLLGQAGQQ